MANFFGEDAPINQRYDDSSDTMVSEADPLKLEIDDQILVQVIEDRISNSVKWYNQEKHIDERRKTNRDYMFGQQVDPKELKYYNARYIDNIIYESMGTIKPIALGRLPDLIVKPGNFLPEQKKSAESLTKIVNSDIRKIENRQVLGLAFRHWPVYLVGAIKAVWDPEKDDYRFKVVHPDNLVLDHTAATNNVEDMSFVAEKVEMTIKEAVMMFPKKEAELLRACGIEEDNKTEKKMATPIKIWEVWFKWPQEVTDESGGKKWQMINGVIWKYGKLILEKIKNPYWDWEGKNRLYVKEAGKKRQPNEQELRQMMFGEMPGMGYEQYYSNYFSDPKFPYIFMGYDQWGEMPLDETSPLEQVISLQDNVNKRGKQITEMNDRAKGKHIFSTEGGIEKKTIEEMDMNNPDEDILVDGDVTKVHAFIPGTPAPAQLGLEQEQERQKAFAKMKTHSTTRGERTTDVATTNQILREADYGGIDDMVNEMINPAAQKMAEWAMQFIRLFYTVEHTRTLLGKDGQSLMMRITRDTVDDGMEVIVSASGVDKLQAKKEAFEMARMKLIDPITFYEDVDVSDPVGRANKLMTFMLAPELYKLTFVDKMSTADMAAKLQTMPVPGTPAPAQPVPATPQAIPQTTPVATPVSQGGGNPLETPANSMLTPHANWIAGYGGGSPTFHREI